MKRILFLTSFFILASFPIIAAADSIYYKANRLYQEGKYEEAIESYISLVNSGYESATLNYNLGNSFFRSNKLGKARLYYEKALKINPSDEDAQANILFLKGILADKFEEVPVIFYKKWGRSLVLALSSDQWAYISAISFVLAILTAIVYLLFRIRIIRKSGFYSSIIFLMLSFGSMFAAWKQYKILVNPDSAVVTELSVNAKSAPRETGTGLFILHEGAKVWLEDKTGGWQEIRLSDGRKGWVPEASIEAI